MSLAAARRPDSCPGTQDTADAVKSAVATVLHLIVTGTKSAIEQLNNVITTGETGKPDEKQSIDCVLITKENADKLDNFVLSE